MKINLPNGRPQHRFQLCKKCLVSLLLLRVIAAMDLELEMRDRRLAPRERAVARWCCRQIPRVPFAPDLRIVVGRTDQLKHTRQYGVVQGCVLKHEERLAHAEEARPGVCLRDG